MHQLEAPGATATIDAARGGRLASLRVGGSELLVGPPDTSDASLRWGCYLMAPWAGRLADGRLHWGGRSIQLRRTHGRHAIHGLVWAAPWTMVGADAATAELETPLARDGWPLGGRVRQRFRLEPGRLVMEADVIADAPMPAALGWHPWFLRRDGARLLVDGGSVLETRAMIPTGRRIDVAGRVDLRDGPLLGRRRLDHAFVGVRPPIELAWPDLTLRLDTDPWLSSVVVHTPPHAICIEPQSAWPNALGLPRPAAVAAGARILGAGESLAARLSITWG